VQTATGLCFGGGQVKAGDQLEKQGVDWEDNIKIISNQ
jgi:hypothetical protein